MATLPMRCRRSPLSTRIGAVKNGAAANPTAGLLDASQKMVAGHRISTAHVESVVNHLVIRAGSATHALAEDAAPLCGKAPTDLRRAAAKWPQRSGAAGVYLGLGSLRSRSASRAPCRRSLIEVRSAVAALRISSRIAVS
jgi:hypothetical protein